MIINIQDSFDKYSVQELISYADSGILYCGDFCLSSFVEYIVEREDLKEEYKYTEEDVEEARYEGEREGIRRCIGKLEDL